MDECIFVGIDVAKDQIDVCLQPADIYRTFPNEKKGFDELHKLLAHQRITLAVMESTGGLEIPVAASLGCAGIPIASNPRQVRDFAKASGRLAKTDRLDAPLSAIGRHSTGGSSAAGRRPSCTGCDHDSARANHRYDRF